MPINPSIMAQFEVLNPRASALLSLVDSTGLVRTTTLAGEENLFDQRLTTPQYLHDQTGAMQEALSWVASHAVDKVDYLIVFGIGLGWHWKALLPWLRLKSSRRIVFLEDDLAVIQAFLSSELAEPFFSDPQSTLLFLEDGIEGKQAKEIVTWYAYQRTWSTLVSPAYGRYRSEVFKQLSTELAVRQTDLSSILSELFEFGSSPLRNFGRTIYSWQRSLQASSMFDRFKGCPAIVVAAGPSLEKEIEHIRALSSRALIIAGGSAVNALLQAGITPHLAATVDPNPMQYVRLRQTQPFCLPLLYRSRALYEALMYQCGPLLYLRGGDGYSLVEWFEHALGMSGKTLDGGNSVSNMIIEVAHAFGCRPIMMVGYDLAYTGGARYTSLVSESMGSGESVAFQGQTRGQLVDGTTYDGRSVVTEAKWMVEANWIEEFANKHSRLQLINTAEDGLAINGLTRMSFAEAAAKFCTTDHDVSSMLHLAIQEASPVSYPPEKLARAIEKMSHSFQKVQEIIHKMQDELQKVDMTKSDSPELLELGNDLESQLAYKHCLVDLFMMHTKLFHMRKCIDCRPFLDEDRSGDYDRWALKDRLRLLLESCKYHLSFLFTAVAWGCLNGQILPEAGRLTPLQGTEVHLS
jgi:hypothetical protein